MESEEELADYSLALNHLGVDAFDNDRQQVRVLKPKVLVFDFALGCIDS